MAKCDQYLELMADELGGELSDVHRSRLAGHLSSCRSCRSSLSSYERLMSEARAVSVHEPPESYWAGYLTALRARIESEATSPVSGWSWLSPRPAGLLAAVMFVVVAVALVGAPSPPVASQRLAAADVEALLLLIEPLDARSDSLAEVSLVVELDVPEAQPTDTAFLGRPVYDPFAFLELADGLSATELEALGAEWDSDSDAG